MQNKIILITISIQQNLGINCVYLYLKQML